jgi:hypothetical protein
MAKHKTHKKSRPSDVHDDCWPPLTVTTTAPFTVTT